ncbi:MAG: hypothetical protein ACRD0G_00320 [Acidimicrobiales bacterium]
MADVHRQDVELYRGLEPVLGADVATMLVARLPPPGEELATKKDLDRFATRADLHRLESKFDSKFDGLTAEMDHGFALLRRDLEGMEHRVMAQCRRELVEHTRVMLFGMVGALFGAGALAAGLGQFL